MIDSYKDCYLKYNNNILTIGNEFIERTISLKDKVPVNLSLLNKGTKYCWKNEENQVMVWNIPVINLKKGETNISAYLDDNEGLSEEHLVVDILFRVDNKQVLNRYRIFPQLPFLNSRVYLKADPFGNKEEIQEIRDKSNSNQQEYSGIENNYQIDSQTTEKVKVPEFDTIEALGFSNKHLKIKVIQLQDITDQNDFLLKKETQPLYVKGSHSFSGNIFILNSYLEQEGLMIVKEGPTIAASLNRSQAELHIEAGTGVQLRGTGLDYERLNPEEWLPCYGSTIGVGNPTKLRRLYKNYYTKVYKGDKSRDLFIMSNTWGDRNQDTVVNEEFIKKEIATGSKLGIDIVQIDDGWQKGITSNSALQEGGVWEGYYDFDPDFWDVNKEKFPDGLRPVIDYAKDEGIKIGLWFSPDSSNDFVNWQKDAEVLLDLYNKYGAKYFKLDGIKIRNKVCELNLIKLMNKVNKNSNGRVSFNLDITAEVRFGYLYEKQFGTIFVENRYTDWGNYYPHNTFKNLWQLAELFPTQKFQFEVLSNQRNQDKYENDLLAPVNYSIDYLFATTMVANPLLWMEMSNLSEVNQQSLREIIDVYKRERYNIFKGEVLPIGQMPDGISFSGYQIKVDATTGYFILFREYTKDDNFIYELFDIQGGKLETEILYTDLIDCKNLKINLNNEGFLQVMIPEQCSFVFAKYNVIPVKY